MTNLKPFEQYTVVHCCCIFTVTVIIIMQMSRTNFISGELMQNKSSHKVTAIDQSTSIVTKWHCVY